MFFDNASTTKMYPELIKIIEDTNNNYFYNPSALYHNGVITNNLINEAKLNILNTINARNIDKVIFTGCATESNNLAIRGVLRKNCGKLLFGIGEHPSVYNVAKSLIEEGYNVEFIKLTVEGTIDIEDYKAKLTNDVCFISIMAVSNETGAINNIKELCDMAKKVNSKIIFHSDCVQALGKIDVNFIKWGIDMCTVSGHKIHGPKGIGALIVKNGLNIKQMLIGGGQENNLRSGTENTPNILAFSKAIESITTSRVNNYEYVLSLKNQFLNNIFGKFDYQLNSNEFCSPYIISLSILGVRAETILYMLDKYNIMVGNGSACSSKKKDNRYLSNMGRNLKYIEGNIRISFSEFNTIDEINFLTDKLIECVNKYKGNNV